MPNDSVSLIFYQDLSDSVVSEFSRFRMYQKRCQIKIQNLASEFQLQETSMKSLFNSTETFSINILSEMSYISDMIKRNVFLLFKFNKTNEVI